MFKNKTLMITGGAGSLGNAVVRHFLSSDIAEIRIFSRDEKKQYDMRKLYKKTEAEVLYLRCAGFTKSGAGFSRGELLFSLGSAEVCRPANFTSWRAMYTNVLEASIINKTMKLACLSIVETM
jgi:UDP-glucose 4-epimerase